MNYLIYRLSRFLLIVYFRFFEKETKEKTSFKFFFIVSAGRSGSTLLRKLLTTKYNVHIPPESESLVVILARYYALQRLLGNQIISTEEVELKIKKIFSEQAWKMDDCNIKAAITLKNKLVHPQVAIHNLFKLHAQKFNHDVQLYGDKTPYLVLHLNLIRVIFNDFKIIHLIRDGRNVVKSRSGNFHEKADTAVLRWVWAIEESNKFTISEPESIIEIKYEDLVDNTQLTISKIEKFLELTCFKRAVPFYLDLGDDVFKHHKNIHNKIQNLNREEGKAINIMETELKKKFEKLLYEKGYF